MDAGRPSLQTSEIDSVSESVLLVLASVGPAVRKARLRQRIPQIGVARQVGIVGSVLSRIENGQRIPRLDQIAALCNVVGVRLSDVLRFAEEEAYPLGGGPWTDQAGELLMGPEPDRLLLVRRKKAVMPDIDLV